MFGYITSTEEYKYKEITDFTILNDKNQSLLIFAVLHKKLKIVQFLLSKADINIFVKDNAGYSALHYATKLNLPIITKSILDAIRKTCADTQAEVDTISEVLNNLNNDTFSPIDYILKNKRFNMFKLLMNYIYFIDPYVNNRDSIKDFTKIYKYIIEKNYHSHLKYVIKIFKPTFFICEEFSCSTNKITLKILINHFIKAHNNKLLSNFVYKTAINKYQTLLKLAIKNNLKTFFHLLLKYNVDVNFMNPLYFAIKYKNFNFVRALIKHGANIYSPDPLNDCSALMLVSIRYDLGVTPLIKKIYKCIKKVDFHNKFILFYIKTQQFNNVDINLLKKVYNFAKYIE